MKAFMCMRTGLLFPADYVEQWGIKYGLGLGTVPCSEALVNLYAFKKAKGHDGQESYPIGNSYGSIQAVDVTDSEYENRKAILAIDDPNISARGAIMVQRQIENKKISNN